MTLQAMPSVGTSLLMMSLGWAAISALLLVLSIRLENKPTAWVWAVSFVAASVVAAGVFWRLVRGEA